MIEKNENQGPVCPFFYNLCPRILMVLVVVIIISCSTTYAQSTTKPVIKIIAPGVTGQWETANQDWEHIDNLYYSGRITADERARMQCEVVGKVTGKYVGGAIGQHYGEEFGAKVGEGFGLYGIWVGGVTGGIIGGCVGSEAGGVAGKTAGGWMYDSYKWIRGK